MFCAELNTNKNSMVLIKRILSFYFFNYSILFSVMVSLRKLNWARQLSLKVCFTIIQAGVWWWWWWCINNSRQIHIHDTAICLTTPWWLITCCIDDRFLIFVATPNLMKNKDSEKCRKECCQNHVHFR